MRMPYSEIFSTCLSRRRSDARSGSGMWPSLGTCAFHQLPVSSQEELLKADSQQTWKMRTDKANKSQLQTLIILIKHCVEYHCNATANEDLSVNEGNNMITDGDKESSDHLTLAVMLACTLLYHQHFISPWWLLTQMTVLRFMGAESFYCFSFSLSTSYYYRNDVVARVLQVSIVVTHNRTKESLFGPLRHKDYTVPQLYILNSRSLYSTSK